MNTRALIGFAILVAVSCAGVARAEEPTPAAIAAARELLSVKGASALFDPVIPGVVESVKNSFLPTNPQLGKELNEVSAQLRKEFEPKRIEIFAEVVRVFATRFTEKELKEITAFYRTPTGQKMLREEPLAIEDGLKGAKVWADNFSEIVMTRFRAEMKKKGHTL
jgi:uncharacterized protein